MKPDRVAVGPCPASSDLVSLRRSFDVIISLLEAGQGLYDPGGARSSFLWYNIPMKDHETPSVGQLLEVCEALWSLPRSSRAYIHCLAGIGRSGAVAAGLLILDGIGVEEAVERVDGWTGGLFSLEISSRRQEVLDVLERFRRVFL